LNGQDIPGATSQTLEIFPPYGVYTCYCTSPDGCITETAPFSLVTEIEDIEGFDVHIYPNPTTNQFTMTGLSNVEKIQLFDQQGKSVDIHEISIGTYSIEHLEKGVYILFVHSNELKFQSKIIRM
jgi:hypothetical protein